MLLGYEKALWPKKLEISHASQIVRFWFFLSYLITTVLSKHENHEEDFPNYVCFSKSPNFNQEINFLSKGHST